MNEESERPSDQLAGASGSGAAVAVLSLAAALGVLGDALLRATPWGLNLTLWILAVLVGAGRLTRSYTIESIGGGRWTLGGVVFFAVAFVWHDSPTLQYLNVAGVLVCFSLTSLDARGGRLWLGDITGYVTMTAVALVALPPLVLFAWLLTAADPVFGALVSRTLQGVLPDDFWDTSSLRWPARGSRPVC